MKNNLERIKSTVVPNIVLTSLDELIARFDSDGLVMAYLDNKILAGTLRNSKFLFNDNEQIQFEFIQKLRIFNKDQELYAWRKNGKLLARLRKDGEGSETDSLLATQVIFGTTKEQLIDGFCLLSEERGTKVILPEPNDKRFMVDSRRERVGLLTRNYIGFTKNWQATYVDCRFVDFIQVEEKNG